MSTPLITYQDRVVADRYRKAAANFKRATTNHLREQHKGLTYGSVAQTRRMYFAAMALMRAGHKYSDAQRALFQGRS